VVSPDRSDSEQGLIAAAKHLPAGTVASGRTAAFVAFAPGFELGSPAFEPDSSEH
jgi:hypothetical protein